MLQLVFFSTMEGIVSTCVAQQFVLKCVCEDVPCMHTHTELKKKKKDSGKKKDNQYAYGYSYM